MKRVTDIVAKGEIAHFEQFPLLSPCFQKSSAADASERVCMWERVTNELCRKKGYLILYLHWHHLTLSNLLHIPTADDFENIWIKI